MSAPLAVMAPTARRKAQLLKQAEAALKSGCPTVTAQKCEEILDADPNHLGALEVLAKAQWQLQAFAQVERTTLRLIALNPYEPGYFGLRGAALRALGRYDEAARCMRRDPAMQDSLADLEVFHAKLKRELAELNPAYAVKTRARLL